MECLSRSNRKIYLDEVPMLVTCALSASPDHVLPEWEKNFTTKGLGDSDAFLRRISGGLVDIVSESQSHVLDNSSWSAMGSEVDIHQNSTQVVQLMHQTCKEWVESHTFKHVVLGGRANTTWENGHGFLVKFYAFLMHERRLLQSGLVSGPLQTVYPDWERLQTIIPHLMGHANEAERTTGVSQYAYLSRVRNDFYVEFAKFPLGKLLASCIESGLGFALYNGLWL